MKTTKITQNLLRISQQNNFPFENSIWKKQCISFAVQYFWEPEEIAHRTLTACLRMDTSTIQRH